MDQDDIETNIFVAQTVVSEEEHEDQVLHAGESWFSIRTFHQDDIQDSGLEGLPDGHIVYAEMHNLSKDQATELLRMVLDTIENSDPVAPDALYGNPDEETEE